MDFLLFQYSLYFNHSIISSGIAFKTVSRLTENKKKKIVTFLENSKKYITTHPFKIFLLLAGSFDADTMIWKEGNGGQ